MSRMRQTELVTRMGEMRMYTDGKPEGKNHLEDLDVDGKILKWILK
jgi:hypothetical protein